ncbi:RNA cytidine acetyltransferase-like [Limulus polyphemus]|uniref:RNA cytidine acetyltransferase n=1 Tax=Limulus polyphemus TaxID=6850 RepID=A0ABM1S498_LIMPO|nr:RNA cytidine acetyltransferase-like [Limulus polyphemus]
MVRKKIDNRIRVLIENGVVLGHRSMFVIVGDKGRDQVVIIHHMLSKATVRTRPSVLWCYKKELGFSTHRKKRMKKLQKKIKSGKIDVKEDDPFELFIAATNIRWSYYGETHKILGNTYGMLVLQDFEAITPNLLARTIETVEGGGVVVVLLQSVTSLKQLFTMSMDVHARFRTEAHQNVVGRFNERFMLSLASNKRCLVVDDQLNILPLSSHVLSITPVPPRTKEETLSPEDQELQNLKESLQDTQPVGVLVNCCRTLDQAKAVLKFVDIISEKTLHSTVAMTAARGRGKSAALGLAIAASVAFSYSNIFVTSPSPENLKTLFEFILKGFDVLEYQEHIDYELIQSTNPDFNKAVVRVNIFREHRQTIQYIHPSDANKLGQAELVIIDEAAAIPLPLVKKLLGPYLVFMASTINGYEGTGRSLSLKLMQQLRSQSVIQSGKGTSTTNATNTTSVSTGRILHEITLNESIRYKNGDGVEQWLNELLCLDATVVKYLNSGCPVPQSCQLYYINRDTLFSYHKASEAFLQRIMALYVASHYKNSPNDLQMLSDAPAHHLFCLLPPVDPNTRSLPDVLCVLQVCLEGEISKSTIINSLSRGMRASGDLIPWTVSQQFQDSEFPSLSGVRIVRIATHPDYQQMGYGSRALQLLQDYYEGHNVILSSENAALKNDSEINQITTINEESVSLLEENVLPKKSLPPLLLKLGERPPERLDYIGVSFGLTAELLRFWRKNKFVPVYLRQTANDLTGEHSCIMLKMLGDESENTLDNSNWLHSYWFDFRRRFLSLLGYQFSKFFSSFALSILQNKFQNKQSQTVLTRQELETFMNVYDLKRLELYSQNLVDYHLIMDLLPIVSKLYFLEKLGDVHLSPAQSAILLALGLQYKSVDTIAQELDLPTTQILGLFNRAVRRISQFLSSIMEKSVEETLLSSKDIVLNPVTQSIDQELEEAAKEICAKQEQEKRKLKHVNFSQYSIKGSEHEWQKALQSSSKTLVSIKSIIKKPEEESKEPPMKKLKKNKKFKE